MNERPQPIGSTVNNNSSVSIPLPRIPVKLTSRKFWFAIAGIAVNIGAERFGLSQEQVLTITGLIGTYLVGQGIADHGKTNS